LPQKTFLEAEKEAKRLMTSFKPEKSQKNHLLDLSSIPEKIGPEIQVTNTTGTKSNPSTVNLESGFVVVWVSNQLSTDYKICGQFFTQGGTKNGSEILIDKEYVDSTSKPIVVSFGNGKIGVIWNTGPQLGVQGYWALFNQDGTKNGTTTPIANKYPDPMYFIGANLAPDQPNNAVAMWWNYWRLLYANGTSSPILNLNLDMPCAATALSDDRIIALNGGQGEGLGGQFLNKNGTQIGDPFSISPISTTNCSTAKLNDQEFIAIWGDAQWGDAQRGGPDHTNIIYGVVLESGDGTKNTPIFTIANTQNGSFLSNYCAGEWSFNRFLATWQCTESDDSSKALGAVFNNDGTQNSSVFTINPSGEDGAKPSTTYLNDGTVLVVWQSARTDATAIKAQKYSVNQTQPTTSSESTSSSAAHVPSTTDTSSKSSSSKLRKHLITIAEIAAGVVSGATLVSIWYLINKIRNRKKEGYEKIGP
jgi:hypothetical protein